MRRQTAWLIGGVSLGLLGGVGLAFGLIAFFGQPQTVWQIPVHATATQGQDSFAIATGELDDGVEALYFLDFLTGELKAAVLNPRSGKFTAFFAYKNVFKDLGIDLTEVKNPKFLMVTGATDMRQGVPGTNVKFGKGVIYITELTTGKIGAYTVPWNRAAFVANQKIEAFLVPLDSVQGRVVAIRPGG